MAVRGCLCNAIGCQVAAGTRHIIDHDRFAPDFGKLLSDQARDYVVRTPRCKTDEQTHRPARISLRPSEARDGWEHGAASGYTQKTTAGMFHGVPPRSNAAQVAAGRSARLDRDCS